MWRFMVLFTMSCFSQIPDDNTHTHTHTHESNNQNDDANSCIVISKEHQRQVLAFPTIILLHQLPEAMSKIEDLFSVTSKITTQPEKLKKDTNML
jgi:hypothetical protein